MNDDFEGECEQGFIAWTLYNVNEPEAICKETNTFKFFLN